MTSFLNALPGAISQGLIWGVMAIGVYITYKILDIADLTVDGSFPLGGAVTLTLLQADYGPVTALLASLAAGALAGLCTGLIHVKLKVRALFSGIIMMTALYSVNLRITGGQALLTLPRTSVTLFRNNPVVSALPGSLSQGVLINEVLGTTPYLDFGPAPQGLPALATITGAPTRALRCS